MTIPFEQMSAAEKILHVQDLWDRIAEQPESVPVSDAWRAELDRRMAAHREDPSTTLTWDEVREALDARRGRSTGSPTRG